MVAPQIFLQKKTGLKSVMIMLWNNSPVCQPAKFTTKFTTKPASPDEPVGLEEGIEVKETVKVSSNLQDFLVMAKSHICCC